MVARTYSVAFEGIETKVVEIQVSLSPGIPAFTIVGLPDKAVSEARERVKSALNALSVALPSRKVTVNLSPADLPKEGSHFDLPIAVALLAAIGMVPPEEVEGLLILGELSLDGRLVAVTGALPAAMEAATGGRALVCPRSCGAEAAWVSDCRVLAAESLAEILAHLTGQRVMQPADPGEISLAHNGVLFLDELPEFSRAVLETLRQPVETGEVVVSRANAHVRYPCRFMLVAAANPCRCGHLGDPSRACARAPGCGADYMGRISGPLLDRFDLQIEVANVSYRDLDLPANGEKSADIAARVARARDLQMERYRDHPGLRTNADAEGELLDRVATPDAAGKALLVHSAERFGLSARGYHRALRVARTIADLAGDDRVCERHIAEALSFRQFARLLVAV